MNKDYFTYVLGDKLYVNVTNRCTNRCLFCIRDTEGGVGYNLWLKKEPTARQIIEAAGDISGYKEVVFCGYGEPLMRYEIVQEVAAEFKKMGVPLRVNTNGQASLINNCNVARELSGLIDTVSISLNAENEEKYIKVCRPALGAEAYRALFSFALESKKYIPEVILTVVDWPGVDLEKCRQIAQDLNTVFKVRKYSG